jgi:hypothetical protein
LLPIRNAPDWLKVIGWRKIFQANGDWKQAGIDILISDKVDFKAKLVRRNKKDHFILIKGTINQEDIIIVNIYVPNIGTTNFINQTLLNIKAHIDPNLIIVSNFNTPL